MLGSYLFSCFWYLYSKFHFILSWMIDFHIWKFVLFIIKYVLQKFIMLSFFICLKFICRKVGKIKFKSGKSGKSQGIFAPWMLRILDMSGPQNDLFSFWAPKKRRKDLTWNIAGVTADYRFLLCFFSLFFF